MPTNPQPSTCPLTLCEFRAEYLAICLASARGSSPQPILDAAMANLTARATHLCPQTIWAIAFECSIEGLREQGRLGGFDPTGKIQAFTKGAANLVRT